MRGLSASPLNGEAKDKLFDYIEVFYNRMRIHSATDYFAPAEYEARYQALLKQAA